MVCNKYWQKNIDEYGKAYNQAVDKTAKEAFHCGGRIIARVMVDRYEGDRVDITYVCDKCKCRHFEAGLPFSAHDLTVYLQKLLDQQDECPQIITW